MERPIPLRLGLSVASLALAMTVTLACNVFSKNQSPTSNSKTITNREIEDGNIVFEAIFIDEISQTDSLFRFCPYYAQVPMQYTDEGQEELALIDQLIAAGNPDKNGRFQFLQAGDFKQNLPFAAIDFNNTLGEYERASLGKNEAGQWLRRAGQILTLAASAVDQGATQFAGTLAFSSRSRRETLEKRSQLIAERIEITTATLLSKEAFEKSRDLAATEHSSALTQEGRLSNDKGRDLASQESSQSFALMMKLYQETPRNPQRSTAVCRTADKMLERLTELRTSLTTF